MHGTEKLLQDNANAYYRSEHGIKVVPHNGEWIGYYRIGDGCGKWELILTAYCEGKAPPVLTIAIRSWEDLAKA